MATPIQTPLTIDLGLDQAATFAQALWRRAQKLRQAEADYRTRPISELPGFALFSLGHRVNRWHSFTISSEEQIEELQIFFKAEGWLEAAPAEFQPLVELVLTMDITQAEDPDDLTEEELALIAESEAELAAATALAAKALGKGNPTPAEKALATLYIHMQASDTMDRAFDAIEAEAEAAGMFLVIEEELIEGYYLVHGDPISVHWTEEDAASAVTDLQSSNTSAVYKILPVRIGARP